MTKPLFNPAKNQTKVIDCKGVLINICGLEEYSIGHFNPQIAFKEYKNEYPGIILTHNPDSFPVFAGLSLEIYY